jgi:hypothetical protein
MRCKVDDQGVVSSCSLLADSPAGSGTGAGLLALASKYRLRPESLKSAAPDGTVVINENWFEADSPPDWRKRPTPENLVAVWPGKALAQGRDGAAKIDCLVSRDGGLYDCIVLTETPAGLGFGAAAIALTPQFLMWPAKRSGQPVLSEIVIPISWRGARRAPVPDRSVIPPALSWSAAPSIADMLSLYPAKARAEKRSGFASVQCNVGRDGHLQQCSVLREEPRGAGFGSAGRALAGRFQLGAADLKLLGAMRATVNLPIAFSLGALEAGAGGKAKWTEVPDAAALDSALADTHPSADSGRAVLNCRVVTGGRLEGCTVASEDPVGGGLGAAALALRENFRVATWSNEGLPVVGGMVDVPIRFDFTQRRPPPSAGAAKP